MSTKWYAPFVCQTVYRMTQFMFKNIYISLMIMREQKKTETFNYRETLIYKKKSIV
jgi:hypothetical protein